MYGEKGGLSTAKHLDSGVEAWLNDGILQRGEP